MKVIDSSDRLTIEADDDISFRKSGLLGRAILLDGDHQNPVFDREMKESHEASVERDILPSQPDVTPPHFSFLNELACYKLSRVDGNGKTETLGRKDDCCIDANDISPGSDERASRIPGVQGCIGLDDVID